jgi:hypothetical protein
MASTFCTRWGIVLALLVVVLQPIPGANLELFGGTWAANCNNAPCAQCCDVTNSKPCDTTGLCGDNYSICHWSDLGGQPNDCGMRYPGCPSPCPVPRTQCNCYGI